MEKKYNKGLIRLIQGDITEQVADAIVNPANEFLQHGGGVAGAIVRKGGKIIQEESNKIGHTPVGSAAVTGAGTIKAHYVIHAIGPRMGEGNEDIKLRNAVSQSLQIAKEKSINSIVFPAISTGIFGYPIQKCAEIMLDECIVFLNSDDNVMKISICLWTKEDYMVFEKRFKEL